jgi:hypothetical protein
MDSRTCGPAATQGLYSNSVPWAPAAAPYTTTPASAYRRLCFQPAYSTGCNEPSVNCINTMSTRSGALFNEECASGLAANGQCMAFSSSVPRAVSSVSNNELAMYVQATTGGKGFTSAADKAAPACANNLVMVDLQGKKQVVCPIALPAATAPQCQQTLQRLWQSDRFKGVDTAMYNQSRQMEDCFVYDTIFPNGQTQPVAVKATPQCMAVAEVAFAKASNSCASCASTAFCR